MSVFAAGTWAALGAGALAAGGTMYAANKGAQSNQAMLDAAAANKLDPATVGANSLNAQAGLAGQAIGLNNQYGSKFANSNNLGLFGSLFGQGAVNNLTNSQIQSDPNFAKMSPEVQAYLTSQRGGTGPQVSPNANAGMGPVQFPATGGAQVPGMGNGKSQYENLMDLYQGMGNTLDGTDASNNAFNKWTEDQGFAGWGDNDPSNPAASLGQITNAAAGNVQAPGVLDMISAADKQLNPNYQPALDALGKAANVDPTKISANGITYNNVNQSPHAGALGNFMANGTAPQVSGPGANQGSQHLTNLLGSSGYMPIQGVTANGMSNVNLAGNAATSAGPQMGAVRESTIGKSDMAYSAAPNQINAPTSYNQVKGQNITGPNGFERVGGPSPFSQVTANTDNINITVPDGFERVNAPNLGLQSVSAGQNKLLTDLTNNGFNANRPIQQMLEGQAQNDLGLGGSLSADQTRLVQQASRAAAESRGMVGSNGSMLNEVQRQLDMSRQLQNERRNFAASTEAAGFGQIRDQQDQAIRAADVTNNYLGIDVNAQQSNNQNAIAQGDQALRAGIANQNAGLTNSQQRLDANIANQNTRTQANRLSLDAATANQNAGLTNSRMAMDAATANQRAGLDLSKMGLDANIANQATNLAADQYNQRAGLDISRMGLDAATSNAANAMNNNQFNAGNAVRNNQFNTEQGNLNNQFNANQANAIAKLMAELGMNNNQFNALQNNNMNQFNAGQYDTAANRFNDMSQFNATQNQNANINNQNAFSKNYADQLSGASSLGALFNTANGQAIDAAGMNQNAWVNQRGQTINGLQALLNSDNDMAQFNAGNQLKTDQFNSGQNFDVNKFNAGQDQLKFDNLASYMDAVGRGRYDPNSALTFANNQQNWGMFDPFNQSIMSMYAGNAANAANAGIAGANNSAATNAGLMQMLASLGSAGINAWGNNKKG